MGLLTCRTVREQTHVVRSPSVGDLLSQRPQETHTSARAEGSGLAAEEALWALQDPLRPGSQGRRGRRLPGWVKEAVRMQ